jgi:hypothetical protein
MAQSARVQEPTMEEILASIRRIIADDDPAKPPQAAAKPPAVAEPPPRPAPAPARAPEPAPEPAGGNGQDDIDALMASFDEPSPPPAPPEPANDVLDLTDAVAPPPAPARPAAFKPIEPRADLEFRDFVEEAPPRPAPAPRTPEPRPMMLSPAAEDEDTLVSSQTSVAVSAAFGSLAHTILSQNARTLEDLVKEMLRPMLKQWLDDNLPLVVERLVRAEIERVARGRG